MKKAIRLAVLAMCLVLVLGACGNNNGNNNGGNITPPANTNTNSGEAPSGDGELEEVNLNWAYLSPGPQRDLAEVQEAVNQITLDKINATVTLKPIDGDYNMKMDTAFAAGEDYDIVWTSSWNFYYVPNITKGAFYPMDDLLNEYAPELVKELPEYILEGGRVNGKIYGISNYQTVVNREGIVVLKEFADKYDLDVDSIKKLEDLEPFLAKVAENEPDMIPFGMSKSGSFQFLPNNMAFIEGDLGVRLDDPFKVINLKETDEYKEYLKMASEWYSNGYVNQDAPTLDNSGLDELVSTGKVVAYVNNSLTADAPQKLKLRNGGQDVEVIHLADAQTGSGSIQATMTAINAKSDNPERAMMFLNLLNTSPELYNLMVYGIEDKHYKKISDNKVEIIEDSGYKMITHDWVLGNTFNRYLHSDETPELRQAIQDENNSAYASPLLGFTFTRENVQNYITNITTVADSYHPKLNTGVLDGLELLPEYLEEMKDAGQPEVMAEIQKQLEAWKAENGK